MFNNRRRSRLQTSYTGVNHTAPASNQPNSNALAAALTIGEAMKAGPHKPQPQPAKPLARSNSIQYIIKPAANSNTPASQQPRSSSLLKRSPSLSNPVNHRQSQQFRGFSSGSITSTSSKNTPQSNQPGKQAQPEHNVVYDIDDSFNDSYLDEITNESQNAYFNNHDNLKDLRLTHQPAAPPTSRGGVRNASSLHNIRPNAAAATNNGSRPVKMVKRYIPTPNGIKIVEVPEESFNKEISRSNSLRNGSNIPRAGSLTSASNTKKKIIRTTSLTSTSSASSARKRPSSRLSSLVNSRDTELTENVELEDSFAKIDELHANELKLQALEHQIENEKNLAKDLESKKLEYEKLKLLRLQNEKKLLELEKEVSESTTNAATTTTKRESSPLSKEITADDTTLITKPSLASVDDHDHDHEHSDEEYVPGISIDGTQVLVDELEKKKVEPTDETKEVKEVQEDKEASRLSNPKFYSSEYGDSSEYDTDTKDVVGGSNSELGIINRYGDLNANELSNRESLIEHSIITSTDDEDDEEHASKLAKQLRPTFDVVPEVIDDDLNATSETLQIPVAPYGGSSGSSIHSVSTSESASSQKLKRPIKSAMKNSTSFSNISSTSSKANANAAHQAYLSLTTAENTKLNSKLSSTQLNDIAYIAPPVQTTTTTPNKRLSQQSLRKSPSTKANGGLATRSLRPQSLAADPRQAQQNGGMSGRSLRAPVYAPIPPHPTLQENYQSPSKLKAAELYAKANQRPISVFKPIKRSTSYSKEHPEEPQSKPKTHRTTLRDTSAPLVIPQGTQAKQAPQQPQAQQNTQRIASTTSEQQAVEQAENSPNFQSRFNDSDDEDVRVESPRNGGNGFSSRFNDSDDEDNHISNHVPEQSPPKYQVPTLRNNGSSRQASSQSEQPKKEKKFSKLRKLFGRSN